MSRKSILILSPFFRPNVGGVETHLDDLCRYLTEHNYQAFVITYQPLTTNARGLRVEKKENLEIRRIPWFGQTLFHRLESYPLLEFLYLFPRLFIATFWFMLWKHKEIDVIHAHGLTAACITRIITIFFKGGRTTVNIHAIYNFAERKTLAKLIRWIMKDIDTVMPLAERSKKDLLGAGIPENKLKIYVQWVDQSLFRPLNKESCRKKLNLAGKFFVLFVGRLIEKKGARVLLGVAEKLLEVKFIFVGDGPMLGELKTAEKQLRNVYVAGRKNQEETALYYGAADVVIIPSQYEEGFGRVILEALSCGTPVIGSNKGGIPEVVDESVGILVEPTMKNLKEAIEEFYSNREKLKMLSSNCRKYAEERFSERNAQAIIESYYE